MNNFKLSLAFQAIALLPLTCDFARASEKLDHAVKLLIKSLCSDRLKDLATSHADALKGKTASERSRRDAVDFFYDLKATRVFAALLELEDLPVQGYLFLQGLDVFGVDDIVLLHDAAAAYAKRPVVRLGSDEAVRQDIVDRLLLRTSNILGLKPKAIAAYSREDIRAWFVTALRAAETKAGAPASLREALKQLGVTSKKSPSPTRK